MRIRKPLINKTDATASPTDQRSNGKRASSRDKGPLGIHLVQRPPLVGEEPRSLGQTTETAWVGKMPVEIRLGPIPIRFHVRILPPWVYDEMGFSRSRCRDELCVGRLREASSSLIRYQGLLRLVRRS
jgi:hypothetical protein